MVMHAVVAGKRSNVLTLSQMPNAQSAKAPSFWLLPVIARSPRMRYPFCFLRLGDISCVSDDRCLLFLAVRYCTRPLSNQLFVRRGLAACETTSIASLVSFRPCISPPDLRDRPPFQSHVSRCLIVNPDKHHRQTRAVSSPILKVHRKLQGNGGACRNRSRR
jgi:hypothetical protein